MNLCKIMRDSENCAITQTIHTNHISWVSFVTQAVQWSVCVPFITNDAEISKFEDSKEN